MAYRIETSVDPDEGLYLELALINKKTRAPVRVEGVAISFQLAGWMNDYGSCQPFYTEVASTISGLITSPLPGVLTISVPPSAFFTPSPATYGVLPGRSFRGKLLATLSPPMVTASVTKVIATFILSPFP